MKNNFMKVFFLICILFSILQCGEAEIVTLKIDHYLDTAVGNGQLLTYRVQNNVNNTWSSWGKFYLGIQNFNYEWGHVYTLKAKKEQVDEPLQDASSVEYTLEQIISDEKVASNLVFPINLKFYGMNYITTNIPFEYYLLYRRKIDITNSVLFNQFTNLIYTSDNVVGFFTHSFSSNSIILQSLSNY
ncbi:MAG: DUF4377 domain-containing protein [Spirochaetes bacterium]|nr:DUF4377 domain-containing protein [Spirochaetota bacterium]